MSKRRKFKKGPPVRDPLVAIGFILGGNYLYWNNKPQHPSWLASMQVQSIKHAAQRGFLFLALPTDDEGTDND